MAKKPKINIPPHRLEAFHKLSFLNDDEMNLIYEALRKVPAGVNRKSFSNLLSETVPIDGITEIADGIFSFGTIKFDTDFSSDEIANSLVESFKASEIVEDNDPAITGEKYSDDLFNRLEERLRLLLLSCDVLKPFFDALQIITDSGNILQDSQFSFHVNLLPDEHKSKNVFIHHRLKITFEGSDDSATHSYSLDSNDLIKLKRQVDQALAEQNNFIKNNPDFTLVDPTQ